MEAEFRNGLYQVCSEMLYHKENLRLEGLHDNLLN